MYTKNRNSIDEQTPAQWDAATRSALANTPSTASKPQFDSVEHPKHYNQDDGIQCIDAIRAQLTREEFIGYLRGTIAKYNWRIMHKHPDPIQDASKIRWFSHYLEQYLANNA